MRYHLRTLGCPKNTTDSEQLVRALTRAGHRPDAADAADVLIVNTCGFIDAAKEESAGAVADLERDKRPDQRLLVVGCWAQIEAPRIRREHAGVDATFGIEAWDAIVESLGPGTPGDIPETGPAGVAPRASAYLKISDGCARPCTFCNIPGIKGRAFRSAPIDALVLEARRLAEAGVRELVLVAQDSTAYGEDIGLREGLPRLLERLASEAPGLAWIRLMYAYPGFVTPALVETMAAIPQVCHYLDIPLQHGAASVLRRMKRPHNVGMVHDTLDRLRAAMPDIAIRSTFIVGFPGETKAEFEELLDFVRAGRFDRIGAFTYSPQAGTPAATLPDHVPPAPDGASLPAADERAVAHLRRDRRGPGGAGVARAGRVDGRANGRGRQPHLRRPLLPRRAGGRRLRLLPGSWRGPARCPRCASRARSSTTSSRSPSPATRCC